MKTWKKVLIDLALIVVVIFGMWGFVNVFDNNYFYYNNYFYEGVKEEVKEEVKKYLLLYGIAIGFSIMFLVKKIAQWKHTINLIVAVVIAMPLMEGISYEIRHSILFFNIVIGVGLFLLVDYIICRSNQSKEIKDTKDTKDEKIGSVKNNELNMKIQKTEVELERDRPFIDFSRGD